MFGSGRLFRKADCLSKVTNLVPSLRQCRAESTVKNKIHIPPRIERDSTDILKALASTVELDPTAFHYKFIDDPFLYPYSVADKRVYALSKESGKNSAEWIIKENPGFFKHNLADPPIEAFLQKNNDKTELEFTEKELLNAIEERDVLSAVKAFEALKSSNIDVQVSTKQSLLELLCFYNGEEKPKAGLEERWLEGFLGRAGAGVSSRKKWNQRGLAVRLFEEMDALCPLANSAMIQGLLKYEEIDKAVQLYETTKAKEIKLSVGVYNALLENARFILREQKDIYRFVKLQQLIANWKEERIGCFLNSLGISFSKISKARSTESMYFKDVKLYGNALLIFFQSILTEMTKLRVQPNLGTLNGALNALHKGYYCEVEMKLIRDFLNLNIEPSLGSYGYLFWSISKAKFLSDPIYFRNVMKELMNYIENREHEILHPSDLKFFINSMVGFADGLEDPDLALRLHEMYLKPSNRKFHVRAGDEHGFYKIILKLLFEKKPIEFAMDFYQRYKMTVASPESSILKIVISAIHENLSSEYLLQFWKDLSKLRYDRQRHILMKLLELTPDFSDELSLNVFHEVAVSYFKLILTENDSERNENSLPAVLDVFVRKDDAKMLQEVVDFIEKNNVHFINMDENLLKNFFEYAINKKNVSLIRGSLKLASREELASISEMLEKALPYLNSSDDLWLKTLTPGKGRRQKGEKTKVDDSS